MATAAQPVRVPCRACPLLACDGLRPLDQTQLMYMEQFKQGELNVERGATVLVQGTFSPNVFTLMSGVLMRYKLLEDGRRQIVNFMFPGDLIGVQGALKEPMSHSVEALTPALLCVFPRNRFIDLIKTHPQLAFDITWIAAKEEMALEDHLLAIGQRNARERIAYLAMFLVQRALDTGICEGPALRLTITQSQIADMLGLSVVHTNRSLQSLRRDGLLSWTLGGITVQDVPRLAKFAHFETIDRVPRPYV